MWVFFCFCHQDDSWMSETSFFASVAMRFSCWWIMKLTFWERKVLKNTQITLKYQHSSSLSHISGELLFDKYSIAGSYLYEKYFSEDGMLRVWRWRQGRSSWYSEWAAKISRMHGYFMLCNLYGVYSILGFYFCYCFSKRKSIPGMHDKKWHN